MREPQRRELFFGSKCGKSFYIRGLEETQENLQLVKIHEKIHTGERAFKKNEKGTHT